MSSSTNPRPFAATPRLHAGDTGGALKLLCRGKVLTATMSATLESLGVAPGSKVIAMRGAPAAPQPSTDAAQASTSASAAPGAADTNTTAAANASDNKALEVRRILAAVEAVSRRTSNPDNHYFELRDQVCTPSCVLMMASDCGMSTWNDDRWPLQPDLTLTSSFALHVPYQQHSVCATLASAL